MHIKECDTMEELKSKIAWWITCMNMNGEDKIEVEFTKEELEELDSLFKKY